MSSDPSVPPPEPADADPEQAPPFPGSPDEPAPATQRRRRRSPNRSSTDPDPPPGYNPFSWLVYLTRKYPFLRYIWVGVALILGVAIANYYGLDLRAAFLCSVVGVLVLVNFVVYQRITSLPAKRTHWLAVTQMGFSIFAADAFVAALGFGVVTGKPIDLRYWISSPQAINRVDYPEPTIPVRTAFSASTDGGLYMPNVPDSASPKQKLENSLNKWKEWLHDGAGPKNPTQQLLVVRAIKSFDRHYNTFSATLTVDNDSVVELLEGTAFLESLPAQNSSLPVYRQVRFKIEKKSLENSNVLDFVTPDKGESLFLIVKVRARGDHALPMKPEGYGIQIRKR